MLLSFSKLAIRYKVKASPYYNYYILGRVVDSTITSSLLTNTLASKRSTHSIYFIALVVRTILVLQKVAIYVLYTLNELSLLVDPLALLVLSLNSNLFYRISNK